MWRDFLFFLKLFFQILFVMLLGFGISIGVLISVQESMRLPTPQELAALDNVSAHLGAEERHTVKKSRNSVLRVLSGRSGRGSISSMSGTYLVHNSKYYVLTAAHGIKGECEYFFVATSEDNLYDCIRYIDINQRKDYAIIEIEKVSGRIPLRLSQVIPSNSAWKEEAAILNETFYTGYPNSLGPLTFEGSVAGLSKQQDIYLHSYAWPGSSGAGVFSREGKLIGIVLALNVGLTSAGYDVLEDLVIVLPLFKIEWDLVYAAMEESAQDGDTGDSGE